MKIYCPVDEKETNIKADGTCEQCDSDLKPLLRLKGLPKAYFEEALKFKEEGQVDAAIEKLVMAINLDNKYWEASFELGKLYTQKGLYEDARAQYKKALEIAPTNDEIIKANERTEALKNQFKEAQNEQTRKLRIFKNLVVAAPVTAFLIGLTIIPVSTHFKKHQPVPTQTLSVQPSKQETVFPYTVKSADCLELIAYRFYGDRQMWKKIYEANKDKINNPNILSAGQGIAVPIRYK